MASRNLRQHYLEKSANYLTWSSPSTARALQLEQLAFRNGESTWHPNESQLTCLACGHSRVSLRTAWPEDNTPSRKQFSQKSTARLRKQRRMIIRTCGTCERASKHRALGPSKQRGAHGSDGVVASVQEAISHPEPVPKEVKSAATSGKRRAKTRREGLQALLDKSKQELKPSPGLNLMDFMRTN